MKVRIGIGAGTGADVSPATVTSLVDDLDELGFDSLWLPEILTVPSLDPLVGLAYAAAHNPRVKLGTTMLLPGRNPVRLAKELATLDLLSDGRLLLTFVPGIVRRPESGAVGVPGRDKAVVMDEMLPLLRRLWAGEVVSHHGYAGHFDEVSVAPLPVQHPLEMWTGGLVPAALERCGRHADGWLPSALTPDEAAEGKAVIEQVAEESGRRISPEHFGVSIGYSHQPLSAEAVRALTARRQGVDPEAVVPVGVEGVRAALEAFIEVGFSKFVVRPVHTPPSWRAELEQLAEAIGDLQT